MKRFELSTLSLAGDALPLSYIRRFNPALHAGLFIMHYRGTLESRGCTEAHDESDGLTGENHSTIKTSSDGAEAEEIYPIAKQ